MTKDNIIRLLTPPVVPILWRRIVGVKIQESLLPKNISRRQRMVVIGNGPSLNVTLEKFREQVMEADKMVVNFFATTDFYDEMKPEFYVLADPELFNTSERYKNSVQRLFDCIVNKTTWKMTLVMPQSQCSAPIVKEMQENNNITIAYYRNTYQDVGRMTKFEAWDRNLIPPPAQTVVNTCVYLSLFWGYEETYLIGADTSFLEDVRIDQQTNKLYVVDKHFYNAKDVYAKDFSDSISKHGTEMVGWKLHDLICAYGNMFKMYAELKEYADYKGLKVYNASEYSWINVFERKKLR